MYEISDRIQKIHGDSEKYLFLKLLMESICQLEEDPYYNARGFEGYVGRERTFVANLKSKVEANLNALEYSSQGIIVENEFTKEAQEYARNFCCCQNAEATSEFERLMRDEAQDRGVVSPDLIIHSPLNMKSQIMYLEAKFANNPEWFKDFAKITRFKKACQYLKNYTDSDHNPEFFFHVYLFVAGNLEDKIKSSYKNTKEILRDSDQDIICIYKKDNLWYASTLREILDKLEIKNNNK